jgi:lanosterol synthase
MIEYCYPECTTSVITSLAIFRKHVPHYRSADIEFAVLLFFVCRLRIDLFLARRTIRRAVVYLHDAQKPEGGWLGSWGICFTYATQFALESLSLVGETYETSESARRACEFLIRKQRADGGWGESYKVSSVAYGKLIKVVTVYFSLASNAPGWNTLTRKWCRLAGRQWP